MKQRLDRLCRRLQQDGVCLLPFVMIGYALLWIFPNNWTYQDVMEVYADYIDDAPERVHAELCRRLLAAGLEIRPQRYFQIIKEEFVKSDNGIPVE